MDGRVIAAKGWLHGKKVFQHGDTEGTEKFIGGKLQVTGEENADSH